MDVQTVLIYIGVVVVSAVVILLVSMFGIKEKSYEEAIAEQRKLPDDLLLSKKDKSKEKKHKNKSGKKVKEKKEEKEEKDEKDEKAEHVQFEETPQILPPEPPLQEGNKASKKKNKPEKVKPILINKDEPLAVMTVLSPSQPLLGETNHFELIQPKDDLELIRSHSKENLQQINQSEPVVSKSPKDTPTKLKKNVKEPVKKKEEIVKEEKKDVNVNMSAPSAATKDGVKELKDQQKEAVSKDTKEPVKESVAPSVQVSNKESKKTKKKNDILAQIGGDKDAVNVSLLMLFIQKAELSRSEIQILIDQLLNKQLDNPSEHSEWTEGRADPVIKLKKQLAEKEKALDEEHKVSVAFQNKLKELRAEFNADRSRLSANIKHLEEALNSKVTEAQTSHTRMQHILETHAAEKQGFARQIEQLQSKVNEDAVIIHKMQEEQSHMQQELIAQCKQLEVQIAQTHENENALKAQLAQKHVEVQEMQVSCANSTAEIEMLQQQLGIMQGQLIHTEGQLQHFKDSNDRLQDVTRQLEESRRAQSKSAFHEQELQKQVNSLQTELNVAKVEASEVSSLKSELAKVQGELLKVESELSLSKNEAKSEAAEIMTLKTELCGKEEEFKKFKDVASNELMKFKEEAKYAISRHDTVQKELEEMKNKFVKAIYNIEQLQNEIIKHQNESRKLQGELTQAQANLAKAHEQITADNEAVRELKVLKAELQRLQIKDNMSSKKQIQITRLQEENDRLLAQLANFMELQTEIKKLHEENESLASQLAATTKRPAGDGHENGIEEKLQENNTQLLEHNNLLAQKDSQLEAFRTELTLKEAELNRLTAQVEALQSDVDNQNSLVSRLQNDLDAQRSKNNELRTKNWKVMEALSAAELRAKSNNGKGIVETTQKIIEQQELTKAFLQRIFPEIKITESSHEKWLNVFETKVYSFINALKDKHVTDINSDIEKQNKNLQGMVTHYKQLIDDTEDMLNKLQSHIESEETRWQAQLLQKENEISNLRVELTELKTKLSTNEKLQDKVSELETKLEDALTFREQANAELAVLRVAQKSVANENICNHDFSAFEKLQEERARLSEELETETNKRATLDEAVVKLNALIKTSESKLTQEKNRVTELQEEISQLKNEVCGGCSGSEQSMLNGPPTSDSPIPEQLDNRILEMQTPHAAAQSLIAALESTLLKNTEFANCPMTKSMNLVQSQQELDTSSLTSKYSSKSCHMTDHNSQASWNPLIGQQQKKPKKKRKSTKKSTAKRRRFAGWFKKKITSKNKLR